MQKKEIASTLAGIRDNMLFQKITDLAEPVAPLVEEVKGWWGYSLYDRKPGPAVVDGEFVGTDLDLACFLSALAERGAVINLPTYTAKRATTKREGERVISKNNRHGRITGLISNQAALSFSLRVLDMNVVTQAADGKETVGAPRNFMLVDLNGRWHDGWRRIEFSPTAKENAFLNDKKLWTGHTVVFKNFVHPNRWTSFFGQYYLLTKVLIECLEHEAGLIFSRIKELRAALPPAETPADEKDWAKTDPVTGDSDAITIDAFESFVDFGGFHGEPAYGPETTLESLQALRKKILYTDLAALRFAARTVELAFWQQSGVAATAGGSHRFPAWVRGATWQPFVFPKKRITWQRLVLGGQEAVGERGVSLLWRTWKKTEHVAVER